MNLLYSENRKPPRVARNILDDQLRLLVRLRWLACVGIVAAGFVSTQVFPVLESAGPSAGPACRTYQPSGADATSRSSV